MKNKNQGGHWSIEILQERKGRPAKGRNPKKNCSAEEQSSLTSETVERDHKQKSTGAGTAGKEPKKLIKSVLSEKRGWG